MRQLLSFVALTFLVALGLHRGLDRIASANRDPELRVNQEVAEFLAGEGAGALIFARPLPEELIIDYLRRAEISGGPGGREMARQRLQQVDTSPFDYQRILVFSWLGRERILPADALRDIEPSRRAPFLQQRQIGFLVVFSDFEPADTPAGELLSLYALEQNLAFRFQSESKGARVYRIPW